MTESATPDPATPHDAGYRELMANPIMVRDLLQGFVHEPWVQELDFSTLEPYNASFTSNNLERRSEDAIWRVRLRGNWLYVYLLLEFQSTVDPWMALRVGGYVCLLWQDLLKREQLESRHLPPVLPMVLYNGEAEWRAVTHLHELLDPRTPAELLPYQPQAHYWLLDEGRYTGELEPLNNFFAAVIQLEQSRTPAQMRAVVQALSQVLRDPQHAELARSLAIFVRRCMHLPIPHIKDGWANFEEIDHMLANRTKEWDDPYAYGVREGLKEGRKEGIERGRMEGEYVVLRRQLTRKFGPLPTWVEERLGAADTSQLEAWADAVLDAGSLTDIFDPAH